MQVKPADDPQPLIDALTRLLNRPDVGPEKRQRIEQELWQIKAGAKAERDAAFEMEFYLSDFPDGMTIHDLRIDYGGRVAQIDHIIIDRFLEVWVCESKSFKEGVVINEHGEWSSYYQGKPRGVRSPIEQNRRHALVLEEIFANGLVRLPKLRGITVRPTIRTLVLIANEAHIVRPKGWAASRVDGLDTVIKSEQLMMTIGDSIESANAEQRARRLVDRAAIEILARDLAALHSPLTTDWAARFGISQDAPAIALPGPAKAKHLKATSIIASRANLTGASTAKGPGLCESCGETISTAELTYCRSNARRFGGRVLCFSCQKKVPRLS